MISCQYQIDNTFMMVIEPGRPDFNETIREEFLSEACKTYSHCSSLLNTSHACKIRETSSVALCWRYTTVMVVITRQVFSLDSLHDDGDDYHHHVHRLKETGGIFRNFMTKGGIRKKIWLLFEEFHHHRRCLWNRVWKEKSAIDSKRKSSRDFPLVEKRNNSIVFCWSFFELSSEECHETWGFNSNHQ